MNWMSMTSQILFGIVVIILLYVITLVVLNIDAIIMKRSSSLKPMEETSIIDGYGTNSFLANRNFNTINEYVDNFVKIGRSVNTHGGLQFTYQFWVYINDVSGPFKDQVILLKGDNRKYKFAKYDVNTHRKVGGDSISDHYITCPLIKFGQSYKEIVTRFNTNKQLYYDANITMNMTNGVNRRNALSLLPLSWYLMTFVFEDNFDMSNTTENGIKFTFYLNDFPYYSIGASTDPALRGNFLRQNEGNVYILPGLTSNSEFLRLGNIKYYNYALQDGHVARQFAIGPPTHNANISAERKMQPPYLSAYNKLDIYNY